MTDVQDEVRELERTAVVATTNGPVQGYRERGLNVFKGLRYAAPPLGTLRFKPPQRPAPWTEVADAVALGAPAIQVGVAPGEVTGGRSNGDPPAPGQPGTDEDCLYINVWTQGLAGKRPVMVWLHGGGFANGSGGAAMYDGGNLARRGDVVTVTVNHRLNVFGYLHLGELGGDPSSGQAGMLDIVLVLEWVRDNIASFGGDPANVTIFGESGGGAKVSMLQAMPGAHGLFHRAIVQSGPGLRAVPTARATENAKALLDALGVKPGELARLETLPAAEIQAAAAKVAGAQGPMAGYSPCIDGLALPRDPFHPDAPAISAGVPVMIGTNKDETTLFLRGHPKFGEFTEDDLAERAKEQLGDKAGPVVAALRKLFPDYSPTFLICAVQTVQMMWLNSVLLAERKAAQGSGPVYMYMLTWETPAARGSLKCPHALEIPLVFDNVESARDFVGRHNGDEPQRVSDQMSEAWLAFARTGNPATAALPDWPAYDAKRRGTMIFDLESKVVDDPWSEVRRILQA
jgi:para-nitrobenzyl esterase